jgi:hypothetical protein
VCPIAVSDGCMGRKLCRGRDRGLANWQQDSIDSVSRDVGTSTTRGGWQGVARTLRCWVATAARTRLSLSQSDAPPFCLIMNSTMYL